MPITTSAKKALRVSARKKLVNDRRQDAMKSSIKKLKKLVAEKKVKEAGELFRTTQKAIDKAAKRGVIKPNAAARKKSRLSAMIKKAK
ncbi:MAG: 30S ribosomal protein S20 [Minisyncoccia bacterium]